MPPSRRPLEQRFWAKVAIVFEPGTERPDPRPCWLWTGAKSTGQPNDSPPRGHIYEGGASQRMLKAHIVSFELANGRSVRKHYDVCHDGGPAPCVSPLCVNPFHLFEARHRENVLQWVLKNRRNAKGHWTPRPKPIPDDPTDGEYGQA